MPSRRIIRCKICRRKVLDNFEETRNEFETYLFVHYRREHTDIFTESIENTKQIILGEVLGFNSETKFE